MLNLVGETVLVVEDEWLLAECVVDVLTVAGAEILGPCSTVAQALAALARCTPTIATLDWNLGGVSSAPIAEALQAEGVPFVFLSGALQEEIARHFPRATILPKPYPLDDLPAALTRERRASLESPLIAAAPAPCDIGGALILDGPPE